MRVFNTDIIDVTCIGNRSIVIKGIGKMFYQDGFPISMSVDLLTKKGLEVSYLHIADELLKNGWKPETVVKRLGEDNQDALVGNDKIPLDLIKEFCYKEYEDQRDMIFKYLFSSREEAASELRSYLT